MAATPFLDDPSTPARLRDLNEALKKAVDRDDRGRVHHLNLELKRLSASIRDEVISLHGRANPDLLIALWTSAQMTHSRGLEYAGEGAVLEPEPVPVPEPVLIG